MKWRCQRAGGTWLRVVLPEESILEFYAQVLLDITREQQGTPYLVARALGLTAEALREMAAVQSPIRDRAGLEKAVALLRTAPSELLRRAYELRAMQNH